MLLIFFFFFRDPSIKRTTCKHCHALLIPGVTARVRVRSKWWLISQVSWPTKGLAHFTLSLDSGFEVQMLTGKLLRRNNSFEEHSWLFVANYIAMLCFTHTRHMCRLLLTPFDTCQHRSLILPINKIIKRQRWQEKPHAIRLKGPELWKKLNKAWGELWATDVICKQTSPNLYCFLREEGETHCSDMPWLSYSKTVPLQTWLCLVEWTRE